MRLRFRLTAFTIIELVIVLLIIGVSVDLLTPVIGGLPLTRVAVSAETVGPGTVVERTPATTVPITTPITGIGVTLPGGPTPITGTPITGTPVTGTPIGTTPIAASRWVFQTLEELADDRSAATDWITASGGVVYFKLADP
ncbi:MAG: hypothetical protein AAFV43_08705 [Planctomycetota bacterium]